MVHGMQVHGECGLLLVHTIQGLLTLLALGLLGAGLLGSVHNTTDHDDLVAGIVFQGEGEGTVGLDTLLLTTDALFLAQLATQAALALAALALAEDLLEDVLLFHLLLVVLLFLLVLFLIFFVLFLFLVLGLLLAWAWLGSADSLFVNLDGALLDQLVDMQLLLALFTTLVLFLVILSPLLTTTFLLLWLASDTRQISFIGIEDGLNALFAQGLLGIQFVLDLELGQFQLDLLLLLFSLFQDLFQLLTILDLRFLHLVQTVLVLGHNDEQGHLLMLSGHTNNLHLLIFVVGELALALHNLNLLRLLATQWEESSRLGLLLLTELTSPWSPDLGSADHNHLGVFGDGILRHSLLQFLVGLLGDELIDLLTALLWLALEVAFLDLGIQAGLDGLDESLLSSVALVDHNGGGGLDLGLLGLSGLFLEWVLSLQALLQSSVSLAVLLLVQSSTSHTLQLTLGLTTGTTLNGSQSQLESTGRDDGVLVIVLLLGLLVQLGGQLAIGLFQLTQQLVLGLALVALLLASLLLLTSLLAWEWSIFLVLFILVLVALLALPWVVRVLVIVLVLFALVVVVLVIVQLHAATWVT